MITIKFPPFFIFVLLVLTVAGSALAQTGAAETAPPAALAAPRKPLVGISPVLVIANVQPGKTFTQDFALENSSGGYVRFRCTLGDYWFDKSGGPVLAPAGTLDRSASNWIQFTPSEILVAPRSTAVVKALISVPESAVGGYYSMPFFEAEAAEAPNAGPGGKGEIRAAAAITIQIGGLMMLSTEKTSDYKIDVLKSHVDPPTENSELGVALEINNHGNAHAYLRGVFAILDETGKLVGQGKFEDRMFMPAQTRTFKGSWAGELPAGKYTVLSTLSFDRAGQTPTSLVSESDFAVLK